MSACSLFISYAIRFNVILAAKLRFLFQIRVIIAKNIKFLDHGVGSSDHFQESVILIMIHYCLNSHVICLDK